MKKDLHRTMIVTVALAASLTLAACQEQAAPPPAAPTPDTTVPAAGPLPLPEFTDCASTAHPTLPAKWQAVALMQDFVLNSLMFGNFVYDEAAQAFRFTLADRYGIDLDFLTTEDGNLYLLEGGGELPSGCALVTSSSPFTVPARDWLNDQAVCVGQAPILERDQQWWKSPSGEGANWFWYDAGNGLPFRNMYYEDQPITDPVPIYEHFTFNYFPTFEEVSETNLQQIVDLCASSGGTPTPITAFDINDANTIVQSNTYPTTNAQSIARIQEWIPSLSECSSTGALPPPWRDQVQLTAFMTAVSFPPNPFPTRVYYDWTQEAQNSSLFYNPPTATDFVQVALLTGDTGYIRIQDEQGNVSMCQQALPGPQVPNWNEVDGCECRMQIAPGTVLNPSGVPTKILWCPTDLSAKQVFWTWYSDTGTPVVFMQTNSSPTAGTGLNLADYTAWSPGSVAPAGTFDLPAACDGQPKVDVPQACHNCHLPLNG